MTHYTTATREILKLWTPEQIREVFNRLRPCRAESLAIFQRADRRIACGIMERAGMNPRIYTRQTIGRIANELKEAAGLSRYNLIAD